MKQVRNNPVRNWFAILAADVALDWRAWAGIVAVVAVAVVLALYFVGFVRGRSIPATNWGFGPDWDCGNPVLARDLVCIKKPAQKPE